MPRRHLFRRGLSSPHILTPNHSLIVMMGIRAQPSEEMIVNFGSPHWSPPPVR